MATTNGVYQPTVFPTPNEAQPQAVPGPDRGQQADDLFRAFFQAHDPTGPLAIPPSSLRGPREVFHHIVCMPAYQYYSPEELRLQDYKNDPILSSLDSGHLLALYRGQTLVPAPPIHIAHTSRRYGASIVTFEIGKDSAAKPFVIHESLISHRSEFVRLALQNDWKEAQERKIPLPDDEPDVFETYQIFLYDRDIYKTEWLEQYQRLVKAYLLGQKLLDIGFKNAIIDAIIVQLRATSYFDPRLTNLVYDNTPESCPLRHLLRDIYVWTGSAKWFNEKALDEPINADFMRDVNEGQFLARQTGGIPSMPPFLDDRNGWRTYHEKMESALDPKAPREWITPRSWKVTPW